MQIKFMLWCIVALLLALVFACGEDSNITKDPTGQIKLKLTDAPIDNKAVTAAVLTISELYIDDIKLESFSKTTVDLLQYQNGETLTLGDYEVPADTYGQLRMVLDLATSANGDVPGCYVEDSQGMKHSLIASNASIEIELSQEVAVGDKKSYIIDFDLRKAIKATPNGADDFDFVSNEELSNAIRIVEENVVNTISGTIEGIDPAVIDKAIIYVFKKGDFDADRAITGEGISAVLFSKAVTSAQVDTDGKFGLYFMPAGLYELQVAAYQYDIDGQANITGFVTLGNSGILGSVLEGIQVDLNSNVNLNLTAEGLISVQL